MIEWVLLIKLCASPAHCTPAIELDKYATEQECRAHQPLAHMFAAQQMNAMGIVTPTRGTLTKCESRETDGFAK